MKIQSLEASNMMCEDIAEWVNSLDYIRNEYGYTGVREILRSLQDHALQSGVEISQVTRNASIG